MMKNYVYHFVSIGRTLIMINLINLAIVNVYNPHKRKRTELYMYSTYFLIFQVLKVAWVFRSYPPWKSHNPSGGKRKDVSLESGPWHHLAWWQPGCPPPIQGRMQGQWDCVRIFRVDKINKPFKEFSEAAHFEK